MQEAYLAPLPHPVQVFRENLTNWLNQDPRVTIDGVTHLYFNTGLEVIPQDTVISQTGNVKSSLLPADMAVAGVSLTSLTEEHTPITGDQVFIRYPLSAALWVGNNVLMPQALLRKLPAELVPEGALGISGFHYGYGRAPERYYDILTSAVVDNLDLRGQSVIEFGAGYGNKLQIAVARGAVAGLGIELPAIYRKGKTHLRTDLVLNFPQHPDLDHDVKLVARDIMSPLNLAEKGMQKLWRSKTYADEPSLALINLGPSYDSNTNADLNPHIRAIELAVSMPGVRTIVAGGYAREYLKAGYAVSSHYPESDALAREMLHEYFEEVAVVEMQPKGLQTLVATKRRK